MKIEIIPALEDNYIYLLRTELKSVIVVDPSDSIIVLQKIKELDVSLSAIWNTHHHWDHTGGNLDLKKETGCKIFGPKLDQEKIPGIDISLSDGDKILIDGISAEVISTPGHTRGGICFWLENQDVLFTGDTLFSLGCGRLFEGSPEEMWSSLVRLRSLPKQTKIYCGHEYTLSNAAFCLSLQVTENLERKISEANNLRKMNKPTVPAILEEECKTNVFLRSDDPIIMNQMSKSDPAEVFAKLRKMKDSFVFQDSAKF